LCPPKEHENNRTEWRYLHTTSIFRLDYDVTLVEFKHKLRKPWNASPVVKIVLCVCVHIYVLAGPIQPPTIPYERRGKEHERRLPAERMLDPGRNSEFGIRKTVDARYVLSPERIQGPSLVSLSAPRQQSPAEPPQKIFCSERRGCKVDRVGESSRNLPPPRI
jgi:hypothetical protein